MAGASFRFDCFELDPGNRRLCRDGAPVELNARYLDALVLLAAEQGRLAADAFNASDNPEFKPARIQHDREIDNEPLRELDRLLAEKKGTRR